MNHNNTFEVEREIVKALAHENIGLFPEDCHFSMSKRVLVSLLFLKSFHLSIKTDLHGRILNVDWSVYWMYPSNKFSVPVQNLTRDFMQVHDVMNS